jgi:cytochrome c oxidase assembly protein subunit 15
MGKGVVTLAWLVGVGILAQGILGGFRVTEDSYVLAVIHGAFAHAVLAGLVVTAVMCSRGWQERQVAEICEHASADRLLVVIVVALTLVQTLLGVLVRQLNVQLLTHISLAAIVALAALGAGMRAWGLSAKCPSLRRCGAALMFVVLVQILLGITAVAFRTPHIGQSPKIETVADLGTPLPVAPGPALITTAHQANAAVMLWVAAMVAIWTWRLLVPGVVPASPAQMPLTASQSRVG